jgi:hypothetical protein
VAEMLCPFIGDLLSAFNLWPPLLIRSDSGLAPPVGHIIPPNNSPVVSQLEPRYIQYRALVNGSNSQASYIVMRMIKIPSSSVAAHRYTLPIRNLRCCAVVLLYQGLHGGHRLILVLQPGA